MSIVPEENIQPHYMTEQNIKALISKKRAVLILFNSDYDLTDFYAKHPGGKKVIQLNIGKDATELFVNEGHLKHKEILQMIETMKIGELDVTPKL